MLSRSFSAALAAGVSFISFSAAAEDAELSNVVVTANRTEMPANQIASSMTVISRKEIERKNNATVIDMLREVPGLAIAQNGGVGQTASVFLRGTNSNHALVMVDGMWVNDPSTPTGAVDFSNLPNENIERIEIIRGPQSAQYGSSAVGGVINIITRKGKGKPEHDAFAEYGRYNTKRGGISTRGEIAGTSYSFSASQLHTNGISAIAPRLGAKENDASDTRSFSGNLSQKMSEKFTAKLNTRYSRVNSEFDNFSSDSAIPRNMTNQFNGRAAGELKLFDGDWTQELAVNTFEARRRVVGGFSGYQDIHADRQMIDWVNHVRAVKGHVVTFGAEWWNESFKSRTLREREVWNRAVYADDQVSLSEAAFAGFSVRYDQHQTYGNALTYKFAPGYRILSTDTVLKASYGTAFKAPSLVQIYDPTTGNRNLNPEKSKGFDIGFEQNVQGDKASFGATIFHNDISQLFGFVPTAPFMTINEQKARTKGLESFFTLSPTPDFRLNITHTYTAADNLTTDRELVRRPKHQANVNASYQVNAAWDVAANLYYSGHRRDLDFNSRIITLPSYYKLDLMTNYEVMKGYVLYGRIDNALGQTYEETFGFARPGFAVTAGAKVHF